MEMTTNGSDGDHQVSSEHIHKITVLIVIFIISVVFTICLSVTVLLTKIVRTQLLGILLIDMVIAVMLFEVIGVPVMIRGELDYPDMEEAFSCQTTCVFLYVWTIIFNFNLVLLGVDAVFDLPSYTAFRLALLGAVWSFAFIFALVEVYGIGNGYIHDAPRLCALHQRHSKIIEMTVEFVYLHLPLFCILTVTIIIVVKYFRNRNNEKPFDISKAKPFVISGLVFFVLVAPLRILYYLRVNNSDRTVPFKSSELLNWIMIVYLIVRPVICIIWTFTLPAFRETIFHKEASRGESIYLLNNRWLNNFSNNISLCFSKFL